MRKYRVMLVDDEAIILQGLRKLFNWEEFECEIVGEAMDGVSAINMAETLRPDILMMDINIPIINGIDALKVIRQRDVYTQFIIVTGYDDFKYCQEALRLDAVDYILKPVDYSKLGEVIRKATDNIKTSTFSGRITHISDDADMRRITQIINWMNDHLSEDVSLQRLSDTFHMNSTYISQMFKDKLGINYHTYLNQIRTNKAKELLSSTDLSITDIAEQCGFNDYRSFTRAFHSTTGDLPSSYRKTN
ncbi:MAG: response regulator [Clostridiales bacterium]|nr:response regulator [Clostridiales bacterium]